LGYWFFKINNLNFNHFKRRFLVICLYNIK
jgi:hypothetical protein